MSKLHIANYFESERLSCRAGEAMTQGMVIKLESDGAGGRRAMKLANSDSAKLVVGTYGVAFKVSADPFQVTSSTVNADSGADLGSRIVAISSGDDIVQVSRPAILEYTADLLHDSLNPAAGGATPAVEANLEIKDSKWCAVGTSGAIASPIAGRVHRTFGTRVQIRLVI